MCALNPGAACLQVPSSPTQLIATMTAEGGGEASPRRHSAQSMRSREGGHVMRPLTLSMSPSMMRDWKQETLDAEDQKEVSQEVTKTAEGAFAAIARCGLDASCGGRANLGQRCHAACAGSACWSPARSSSMDNMLSAHGSCAHAQVHAACCLLCVGAHHLTDHHACLLAGWGACLPTSSRQCTAQARTRRPPQQPGGSKQWPGLMQGELQRRWQRLPDSRPCSGRPTPWSLHASSCCWTGCRSVRPMSCFMAMCRVLFHSGHWCWGLPV